MFQYKLSPIDKEILPATILELKVPEERFADCMNCFHSNHENNPAYKSLTKSCIVKQGIGHLLLSLFEGWEIQAGLGSLIINYSLDLLDIFYYIY